MPVGKRTAFCFRAWFFLCINGSNLYENLRQFHFQVHLIPGRYDRFIDIGSWYLGLKLRIAALYKIQFPFNIPYFSPDGLFNFIVRIMIFLRLFRLETGCHGRLLFFRISRVFRQVSGRFPCIILFFCRFLRFQPGIRTVILFCV